MIILTFTPQIDTIILFWIVSCSHSALITQRTIQNLAYKQEHVELLLHSRSNEFEASACTLILMLLIYKLLFNNI